MYDIANKMNLVYYIANKPCINAATLGGPS